MTSIITSYKSFGISDPGLVREHNEDNLGTFDEIGLWIVADGMGGHDSGEIASCIAVEVVESQVRRGKNLSDAFQSAHHEIYQAPAQGKGKKGMGCTIVGMQQTNGSLEICWVGDSRAYLWNGELTCLTRDHSFVQQLVDSNLITEEQARTHPRRSVITQALGANLDITPQPGCINIYPDNDDLVLLCSDGLNSQLTNGEISEILSQSSCLESSAKRLVNASIKHGGEDNITVILIGTKKLKHLEDNPHRG